MQAASQLLVVLLAFSISSVLAADVYVDCNANGVDGACGEPSTPCNSLANALAVCQSADDACNIFLFPSACYVGDEGPLLMPSNCTLSGIMGSDLTSIYFNNTSSHESGLLIPSVTQVHFRGISFHYDPFSITNFISLEDIPILAAFSVSDCTFQATAQLLTQNDTIETKRAIEVPSVLHFRHSVNRGSILVDRCTFQSLGAAVAIDGAGQVVINDSLFRDNALRLVDLISADLVIRRTTMANNSDASVMITLDGASNVVVEDSVISDNEAQSLLYMGDVSSPALQSTLSLLTTSFTGNRASYGVNGLSLEVLVDGCRFDDNELTAMYLSNSNAILRDSSFSNSKSNKSCVAISTYDDGLSTAPLYNVGIDGCLFTGNSVRTSGGSLRFSAFSNNLRVAVNDTEFSNNQATNGGAVMIDGNCAVALHDCTFSNNAASSRGSAIFCTSAGGNATLRVDDGNVFAGGDTTDDDDVQSSTFYASVVYNDPNHECYIQCSDSMAAVCETGVVKYPPEGVSLTVLALCSALAVVAMVIFSAYCIIWIKDVKRFSEYEAVAPE